MKLRFKKQQYQQDAVEAIVGVFEGQPHQGSQDTVYRRDIGVTTAALDEEEYLGYRNGELQLNSEQLLDNLRKVQTNQSIPLSTKLEQSLGAISLDVEMETGTGKTYVYTQAMFELNKRYGWSKFIIVVPTVAIREGVKKSLECTAEHFREQYPNQNLTAFVFDSANLAAIDSFSRSADIQAMIINSQSFNKDNNIINNASDAFYSRKPVEVIAANRPILILDEPQKLTGTEGKSKKNQAKSKKSRGKAKGSQSEENQTFKALRENFNPLFSLYFSATHKTKHNAVYRLDALDAYNQKLVKRIAALGFELQGQSGTQGFLYFEGLRLDPHQAPRAAVDMEVKSAQGFKRQRRILKQGDDLYELSKGMEQYRDIVVAEISGLDENLRLSDGILRLSDGTVLTPGQARGRADEDWKRRLQIRETIKAHLEKEAALFRRGVKTLSLFFIDEVKKYRYYEEGNPQPGEYAQIFEEEYRELVEDYKQEATGAYRAYLETEVGKVHDGYFSVDKQGHWRNSKEEKSDKEAGKDYDDTATYELIMRDKERLLSFETPLRFIFSHSALREGWDNPNVFQICAMRENNSNISEITKRQQVGRGLRLCVNQQGERLDEEALKGEVHQVNVLTVVANESYEEFVTALQSELQESVYVRSRSADRDYFKDQHIRDAEGNELVITNKQARELENYLVNNGLAEAENCTITPQYREKRENDTLPALPAELEPYRESVLKLIDAVADPAAWQNMIQNQRSRRQIKLNNNFEKFRDMWEAIKQKVAYTVNYNSEKLLEEAKASLDELSVSRLTYVKRAGTQQESAPADALPEFALAKEEHVVYDGAYQHRTRFDLVGDIAKATRLTRRTVAKMLVGMKKEAFQAYTTNPQEFISRAVAIIKACKGLDDVVAGIKYHRLPEEYDESIFEQYALPERSGSQRAVGNVKKAVTDIVLTDSNIENQLVESLERAEEVEVYAKLPDGYTIPTPICAYNPDWAIVFKKGAVRDVYIVAESKGTTLESQLRPTEERKIACAQKLFEETLKVTNTPVRYYVIDSFKELWNKVNSPEC